MQTTTISESKHPPIEPASTNEPLKAGLIQRWACYLLEPIDGASLAMFRISFAICSVITLLFVGWQVNDFVGAPFHFSFIPGLPVLSPKGLTILLGVTSFLAANIGLGFLYRASSLLYAAAFTYVLLIDKTCYQNQYYLFCLLGFLFAITPANKAFSLDNSEGASPPLVPRWSLMIFKVQIALIYFFAGISKLNSDWMRGYPQHMWVLSHSKMPVFGPVLAAPWCEPAITYGAIAIDLSVGFLLLYRRTFWVGAVVAALFHLANCRLAGLNITPILMISAIGLFAAPGWPRQIFKLMSSPFRHKREVSAGESDSRQKAVSDQISQIVAAEDTHPSWRQIGLLVAVHLYVLVQILVPLRRYLYPGDANWTDQGMRFSWSMMMNNKRVTRFDMTVTDPSTGTSKPVNVNKLLSEKQAHTLLKNPGLILDLAHMIANQEERRTGRRPIVKANVIASLNRRPRQDLIDSTVDLASMPKSLLPASWIVPLGSSLQPNTPSRPRNPKAPHRSPVDVIKAQMDKQIPGSVSP